MDFPELLDQLVVPRSNGSEGLRETAAFIYSTLQAHTSDLERQGFTATPDGLQLVIATAFLLVLASVTSMLRGRHGLALLLSGAVFALFIVEMELLWSPVSGLLALPEHNIVATFPGRVGGPTLVFAAHYDTATQFGDHHIWGRWVVIAGPGLCLILVLPLVGLWQRWIRQRELPRIPARVGAALVVVSFGVITWFFGAGPSLAKPSPGALDNGGSVAVLLRLAHHMAARPPDAPTTVKLVFLAAEEERALGSWHYASVLANDASAYVINLDNIGASEQFAYGTKEGFLFSHYPPSDVLVHTIDATARELGSVPLVALSYPLMTMTDARSFLAHGIPTLTLQSAVNGQWPHHLHSARDSRDRVSIPALERTLELLTAIVSRVDRNPLPVRVDSET